MMAEPAPEAGELNGAVVDRERPCSEDEGQESGGQRIDQRGSWSRLSGRAMGGEGEDVWQGAWVCGVGDYNGSTARALTVYYADYNRLATTLSKITTNLYSTINGSRLSTSRKNWNLALLFLAGSKTLVVATKLHTSAGLSTLVSVFELGLDRWNCG